jgi:predicted cobalt transporter CbtA
VPLSEHEQRLLEQIEQSLYAEDPKFARSWKTRDLHSIKRARLVRASVLFVVGLGLLLAGVITLNGSAVVGIALGVAGFLLMLGAAWYALSTRQRVRTPAAPGKANKQPRQSLKARLEERWERRQDGR